MILLRYLAELLALSGFCCTVLIWAAAFSGG
jgi:hypothetical protein